MVYIVYIRSIHKNYISWIYAACSTPLLAAIKKEEAARTVDMDRFEIGIVEQELIIK